MQRALAVSVAVAVGLLSSGCMFNKASRGPTHQAEAHHSPAWKLSLYSVCEEGADEYCVGKHGFTVWADHKYAVGPGPEGQVESGVVDAEDFAQIETAINAALESGAANLSETCLDPQDADEVEFRGKVVLTRKHQEATVLRSEEGKVCFQTAKAESALQLQDAIEALAEKYYPTPFPDKCAETVSQLHALYPELETCAVDADCGYFSMELEPIAAGASEFVVLDSCSKIRPIAVANAAAVAGAKDKLKALTETALKACGERIAREGCTGVNGFDASQSEAKCVREGARNVCRVNPSAML